MIPAELIALAERWASPLPWEAMIDYRRDWKQRIAALNKLNASRARTIADLARRPDRREQNEQGIAELDALILREQRDADLFERNFRRLLNEFIQLGELVREDAPELFGDVPTVDLRTEPGAAQCAAFAESVKRVLGRLLAESQRPSTPYEWRGPLRVSDWRKVFALDSKNGPGDRLKRMESRGEAEKCHRQEWRVKSSALTVDEAARLAEILS